MLTNPRPADLVLKNAKIITVDAAFTIAQAIAIGGWLGTGNGGSYRHRNADH